MYIVIVVGGALFIKAGRLSAADFMAYLLYANVLLNSIRRIVEFTEQFQRGMTGIDRFLESWTPRRRLWTRRTRRC